MIDLSQVSLALRGCTSRSLIILDEFGKVKCSASSRLVVDEQELMRLTAQACLPVY